MTSCHAKISRENSIILRLTMIFGNNTSLLVTLTHHRYGWLVLRWLMAHDAGQAVHSFTGARAMRGQHQSASVMTQMWSGICGAWGQHHLWEPYHPRETITLCDNWKGAAPENALLSDRIITTKVWEGIKVKMKMKWVEMLFWKFIVHISNSVHMISW